MCRCRSILKLALLAAVPLSLTISIPARAILNRYRASYEFENPGPLADESINGNTLVLHGGAVVNNNHAHSGTQALQTHGADWAEATNVGGQLDAPEAFTAEAWIYSQSCGSIGSNAIQVVVSKTNSFDLGFQKGLDGFCHVYGDVFPKLNSEKHPGTANVRQQFVGTGNLGVAADSNYFHHIAMAYDGVTLRLYQDGVLVLDTNGVAQDAAFGPVATNGAADLTIGNDLARAGTGFNGWTDEVRYSWGPADPVSCPQGQTFSFGLCCPASMSNSGGICCPTGTSNSGGVCCPTGTSNSSGVCCATGTNNSGGLCCGTGSSNSSGLCCPTGTSNSSGLCCSTGTSNSSGLCCATGMSNSSGLCCPTGTSNRSGICCPAGAPVNSGGHCCPTGSVDSKSGFCIDSVAANEVAYGDAIEDCANRGMQACTFSQLSSAVAEGVIAAPTEYRVGDIMFDPKKTPSENALAGGSATLPPDLPIATFHPVIANQPGAYDIPKPYFCCTGY